MRTESGLAPDGEVAARLAEALGDWQEHSDAKALRRALLDVLSALE